MVLGFAGVCVFVFFFLVCLVFFLSFLFFFWSFFLFFFISFFFCFLCWGVWFFVLFCFCCFFCLGFLLLCVFGVERRPSPPFSECRMTSAAASLLCVFGFHIFPEGLSFPSFLSRVLARGLNFFFSGSSWPGSALSPLFFSSPVES